MKRVLAVGFWLAVAGQAAAQQTAGSIVGTVRDESGAVLPGATVTVKSAAIAGEPSAATAPNGRYAFPALPPGRYDLTVALSGFTSLTRQGLVLGVGSTLEIDAVLKVGNVAEAVTVTGDAPIVNTTSAKVSASLDATWLRAAPIQRSYHELLKEGPGVNAGSTTAPVAFNVFGSGVNDNAFQLDGADQTTSHAANTAPTVFPNPEILQELEFVGLAAPAEYGSFMGGVFNAVTRQGGNAFHGDLNYFNQPDGLTSRNTSEAEDGGRPFDRDRYYDFSAQVGGPIQKEKLWFFASYQRQNDFFSQTGADPSYPSGIRISRYFAKLTYQPSPRHRVELSANPSDYESVAAGSAFEDPSTINRGPQFGITPSIVWNATLSPRTALEVRGHYYRSNYTAFAPEGEPDRKTRYVALDTGRTTGGVLLIGESVYKKTGGSAKLTHYADRFLGGSHELKVGVQYQRGAADNSFFYNDIVYTLAGVPQNGYAQVPSVYGANPSVAGVFVDDAFRPNGRVTVTAGVRYDHSHIGSPAFPELDRQGRETGQVFPAVLDLLRWDTIAPRLGLNLKLDESGRTVLKGSYGRYYQSLSTAAAFYRVLPSSAARFTFSGLYDPSDNPLGLVPLSTAQNRRMDPDAGAPRTDQFVLGAERQLAADFGVTLHFIYKRGNDYTAWQDVGGSYEPGTYLDNAGADPTGESIPVFRLSGPSAERFFVLGSPDAMFTRYRGVTLGINKRLSRRWQLTSSLTLSKSEGRLVSSNSGPGSAQNSAPIFSSFGQNPNDFVNSDGLLINDRPVLLRTQLFVELPWGMTGSAAYQYSSGRPWGRTVRVPGLGVTTTLRAETLDGSRRLDALSILDLRVEKRVRLSGGAQLALRGDLLNATNGGAFENLASTLGTSSAFGAPITVQYPRRLMLGARLSF